MILSVAFLSPAWPPDASANGIVSYVDAITNGFQRQGHDSCILASDLSDAKPPTNVFRVEWDKRSKLARLHNRLLGLINPSEAMRRRFAGGIVHAVHRAVANWGVQLLEMEETFGLVQLVKPRLSIPVVVRLHGPFFVNGPALGLPTDTAFRRRVRNEGIGISQADAVSAPSVDVLERTRRYYQLPLTEAIVIPNPGPVVPSQRRWSLPNCDRSRLLFVGRFDRHKGGDTVIDAFRIVARRFPQLRLWFVGPDRGFTDESGRRWTIRNYIAERAPEVADRIEWLDSQPHSALPDLRRKAFLTIVASRYENFPMAMLEAMSYGCPIVGTRVGGMAEIIQNDINGVLAQPGDPNDLAKAILDLLDKPEFAARIGEQAALGVMRRYHPATIARKTIAFHQSVLDKTRGRKDSKYPV